MARPITQLTDTFKVFRDNVNTISNNVGDPTSLTTTQDSDLVTALNELDSDLHGSGGGSVRTGLTPVSYAESSIVDSGLVGAVNDIDALIGDSGSVLPTTAQTLVYAIKEIDEDIHGVGGGSAVTDLDTEAGTIVGAINEIEAVFDASQTEIVSPSSFEVNVTGDFTVDASGDVILDAAGNDVILKDGSTNRVVYTVGSDNTVAVTGSLSETVSAGHSLDVTDAYTVTADSAVVNTTGDFTVNASAINLDANGGTVFLKDSGTTFGSLDNTSGNLIVKSGTTTALTFTGANLVTAGTLTTGGILTTGGNLIMGGTTISRTGVLTLDVSSNINLDADGGNIYLKDGGVQYGNLKSNSGDLILQSGNSTAVTFSGATTATFAGNIEQGTSLNTSSNHLGGAINEVHDELDSASSEISLHAGRLNTLESEMDSNEGIVGVSVQWNVDNPYSWTASTSNRSAINDLDSAIGTLSDLDNTTYVGNKDNIVQALNAVAGDVQDLQDSAGTLDSRIGSLANLAAFFDSAGATASIVNALNHMASRVIDVYDENGTLLNT